MTITLLSDQDAGFENKARVRKLPLQVFTATDAQKLETEKQNKKETEASLNADNDTYNGLECSQEQIELVLREKEKILEEARKEAAAIEQEANEKAEQIFEEARMKGFEEGRQKGYEEGLIRAEEENEAKHHENQRFFKESLEKALIEINKEKEKCLREYLEELKDKDIVYLYITGETSPLKTWENMIPDIHGEHYRVTAAQWNFLGKSFNVSGVPTYLIIDREGNIKYRQVGFPGVKTMKEELLKVADQ